MILIALQLRGTQWLSSAEPPALLALVKIIPRQRAGFEMPLALWGRPLEGLLDHPDRRGVRVLGRGEYSL